MSITSEITRIKTNISNAYDELEVKGATIPTEKNSENLAATIESVPSGGKFAPRYISFRDCTLTDLQDEIDEISIENLSTLANIFYSCKNLISADCSNWETQKTVNCDNMFYYGSKIETILFPSVAKISSAKSAFQSCPLLSEIDMSMVASASGEWHNTFTYCGATTIKMPRNCSGVQNARATFANANNVENLYIGERLGASFPDGWFFDLTSCVKLTKASLLDVINKLSVISSKTETLRLGTTNLAKLTAEEISIATAKGWTVS